MSIADYMSLFPVAQQFVGVLTIGSNVGKLGLDAIKTIYNIALSSLENYCTEDPKKGFDDREIVHVQPPVTHEEEEITTEREDEKQKEAPSEPFDFKPFYLKPDVQRHLSYLTLGFKRAVPFLGTYISFERLKEHIIRDTTKWVSETNPENDLNLADRLIRAGADDYLDVQIY